MSLNANLLTKVFGWGQFALQLLTQIFSAGVPTTALGWVGIAGSLITAVGLHAAAESTPTAPAAK